MIELLAILLALLVTGLIVCSVTLAVEYEKANTVGKIIAIPGLLVVKSTDCLGYLITKLFMRKE